MKKIYTLLFALLIWTGCSWGAVNPYAFNSTIGTYSSISGGTILGTPANNDQVFNNNTAGQAPPATSTGFPIGFDFLYDGNVYDKFAVNTNGWIVLGTGTFTIGSGLVSENYFPISTVGPAGFVSAVSVMGMNLQGQSGAELSYLTTGVAPDRVLTVQWKGYRFSGATGDNFNFQIKLYETTNEIVFVFGAFTKNSIARTPQVGLRGQTSSDFHNRTTTTSWSTTTQGTANNQTCLLNPGVLPANGLTFTFSPPYIPVTINPGPDKYVVSEGIVGFGSDYPALPAGFFGPGSDPFEGQVYLQGRYSGGAQEPYSDVVIQRTAPLTFGPPPSFGTVPVEMIEMNLQSVAPIRVTRDGGMVESFFDVFFEISVSAPKGGMADITLQNDHGGVFGQNFNFHPVMTFVNMSDPSETYTFDPFSMGYPALQYSQVNPYPWTLSPIAGEFDPDGDDLLKLNSSAGNSISLVPFLERTDNNFNIEVDETSTPVIWSGNGFNNGEWYYYPNYNWWNVWWYDHKVRSDRKKYFMNPMMTLMPRNPSSPSTIEIVFNYSTPSWQTYPVMVRPPLPSDVPNPTMEDLYIQRTQPLFTYTGFITGPVPIPILSPYIIDPFNPEWISVDIRGYNFMLNGNLNHVCFKKTTKSVDWGDAPLPYPTLLANNGARHTIFAGVFMGNLIDGEANGQPNPNATGDDINNLADEDGVIWNTPLNPGQPAIVTVKTSIANALLQVWVDFNASGSWADAGEQIAVNKVTVAGNTVVNFNVPAGATPGTTFARFRYSTMPNLTFEGAAPNGEVEDHIVSIEQVELFDFGDAPDPSFPTKLASNGARHVDTGLKLGNNIDVEPDGQPNPGATGDDMNPAAVDDEDGIWWPFNFVPGHGNTIRVSASGAGFLDAWMDFNGNGTWEDPAEKFFSGQPVIPGIQDLSMFVPAGAAIGNSYARFRFSTVGNLPQNGQANDGEVEDYQVVVQEEEAMDYGDAPNSYLTLAASNGARHDNIGPNVFMGLVRDLEMNGQPDPAASGDDFNPPGLPDDEDGVKFLAPMIPGIPDSVQITVNMLGGLLQGWIDFNRDGDFLDAGEQIITNVNPPAIMSNYIFIVNVPAGTAPGKTYARFRYSTMPNILSFGPAPNGEVEDYVIYLGEYDLGDAPAQYPTLLASNGAIHKITPLFLGLNIDAEPDGQPDPNAWGDDNNPLGWDDEDGVWWACSFVTGYKHTLKVTTTGPGFFNGWFDYNIDGDWSDPGEQVFTDVPLLAGTTELYVTVPSTAITGTSFARFRFSSQQNLSYNGYADDGEVEDYVIEILPPGNFDMGDAPDPTYPTLGINDGARHWNDPLFPVFMGNLIDWEIDGQPSPQAKGDDNNNLADEDGIVFLTPWMPGMPAIIQVTVNITGGALQGWADFNGNGSWSDGGEQIFADQLIDVSPKQLTVNVPLGALNGNIYTRFRYSTMGGLKYYGCAPNGEVEDHMVAIIPPQSDLAIWHMDENAGNIAYDATVFRNDGTIQGATWTPGYAGSALGFDGQNDYVVVPHSSSLDITGPFSVEAWIKASGPIWYHGIVDKLEHVSDLDSRGFTFYINDNGRLRLSVYSGTNGNGDVFGTTNLMDDNYHHVFGSWDGSKMRVYVDGALEGEVNWSFPPASSSQDVGIGMRLSGWGDLMPFHGVIDEVIISNDPTFDVDWGDAPDPSYQTMAVSNGARHRLSQLFLGTVIDPEVNGLPHPSALGDDNNNLDDEDGVILPPFFKTGIAYNVTITASVGGGFLQGWIDYNRDGDWADPGEQVFTNLALPAGSNILSITAPPGSSLGKSFARFRISTIQNLSFTGYAPDGEVEDYIVYILNPGDEKMHWAQYPDLDPTGMDVELTWVPTADDWMCTETGPVNKIRIWGSFWNDELPQPLNNTVIRLKIWSDVPAGINQPWSMPDSLLWERMYNSGEYTAKVVSTNSPEWWWDPAYQWAVPNSHQVVVRFDFDLGSVPFQQVEGTIYWLEVKRFDGGNFGWKTAKYELRFNDDAVWWNDWPGPTFPGGWNEQVYPGGDPPHPWAGQSFDMAFQLDPPPDPETMDYGDAPDPTYPTLLASNGARHVVDGVTYLGAGVDTDPDGQPAPPGLGDDNDELDDEDGINFDWPLVTGNPVKVTVVASTNTGFLQGWVDFNADGDWLDPGEQVFVNIPLNTGNNNLHFFVPKNAAIGVTYARFRFSTQTPLLVTGNAPDGEVEDYEVDIASDPNKKWFQLPDVTLPGLHAHDANVQGFYQSIVLADDWLCNGGLVTDIHWWGNYETGPGGIEQRGSGINHFHLSIHTQSGPACLPTDPEVWGMDVMFTPALEQNTGLVSYDGSPIYLYEFDLPVPFEQTEGQYYWIDISAFANDPNAPALWRWQEAMRSYDPILCGAVEKVNPTPGVWNTIKWGSQPPHKFSDMAFIITSGLVIQRDWGDLPDLPYPTLGAGNGPNHIIANLNLGLLVDAEPDGLPHPSALGDDLNNLNDADGVLLPPFMTPGQNASVTFTVTGADGYLQGWIDFNGNGTFSDPGEQIFTDQLLVTGTTTLAFTVDPGANLGATFSRFRLSTSQGLSFTGPAPDGEVEDYKVYIVDPQGSKMHYPQPPDLNPTGMDVDLFHTPAADDFLCTETGPITHIRTWMSFADDIIPTPLNLDTLMLIIHADVPAGVEQPWSLPGNVLWNHVFFAGQYSAVEIFDNKPEWWYDPVTYWYQPNNHQHVFRFDFHFPNDPFIQEAGIVYWLEIRWLKSGNFPPPEPPYANTLGWKTTKLETRFNDDAVWWNEDNPLLPIGWNAHVYPPEHPYAGQSFDMSFVINPPAEPETMDYGDAPDPTFPTLFGSNGARHVVDGQTYLGISVDTDPDGQPDPVAMGDDLDELDDEDGIYFLWPLMAGSPCKINAIASVGDALFNGWIDYNQNGFWGDPGEHLFIDLNLKAGNNFLTFIVPGNALPGPTFARFRFSHQPALSYTGVAFDGEVEDYTVDVAEYGNIKWQQLPDQLWSGLHTDNTGAIADDWICQGGEVTDIHWWGNYELTPLGQEKRGLGINHFLINIYQDNNCLPGMNLKTYVIPFATIAEINTGLSNIEGSIIYYYEVILPESFVQEFGATYWVSIQAMSNDPNPPNNAVWRWQEANRWLYPINCGAASGTSTSPWMTITWSYPTPLSYSDMAFVITSTMYKTLNLKLFLEGLYAGAGTMNKAQDEFGDHFPGITADQIRVEFHNEVIYPFIEYSVNNVNLSTSGDAQIPGIPNGYNGNYYLTIIHRNSIETTTALPVSFVAGTVSYDFTTAASQAYGDNQKDLGDGNFAIWGGDVNQDDIVDGGDMNEVDNAVTAITFGYVPEDVNGDGIVDGTDMNMVDNNSTMIIMAYLP